MSTADNYEHTQAGTLMRITFGMVFLVLFSVTIALLVAKPGIEAALGPAGMSALMLIILSLFHALTVRVSAEWIRLSFGVGLVRKSFSVAEIESAAAATTHWYNGWGIKKIRGGWLFNVSGFEVVEIRLKNGHRYMIGTDEPEKLLAAIASVVGSGKTA